MLRIMGIAIAATAVCLLGFYYSFHVKMRVAQLHQMMTVIHMLKGEIGFCGRILEEAFAELGERAGDPFGSFFRRVSSRLSLQNGETLSEIWKDCEDAFENSGLQKEELEIFSRLSREMGFLDVDMQLQTLELVENQLEAVKERAEKSCETSSRMYQSLGVLGAMTVVIILI